MSYACYAAVLKWGRELLAHQRRGTGDIERPATASQQPGALGTFRVRLAVNPGVSMSVTFGFPSRWSVWEVAAHPLGSASALI